MSRPRPYRGTKGDWLDAMADAMRPPQDVPAHAKTADQIAARMGVSRSHVYNILRAKVARGELCQGDRYVAGRAPLRAYWPKR